MTTTQAQAEEAQRLIAQKLAANNTRRPKLRLVENCETSEADRAYWRGVLAMPDLSPEERQRQQRQEWAAKILEPAGGFKVPARYEGYTPETLLKVCGSQAYKAKKPAVLTMVAWADGEEERPGVLITGVPGTGKTALALWAFKRRAERTGESRLRVRYLAFINSVQATYNKNNGGPSKAQLMKAAQIAELLLVDDWGENALSLGESAANDKQNMWREIIDHRNMGDLPTVIITNLTTARLMAQFGEDIISRLQEHCVLVEMNGVDLRKKGAVGW